MRFLVLASLLGVICLLTGNLDAQITPAPSNTGGAAVNFQLLDSRKVNVGDHFVTINQVAPPVFPSPTPTATPSPTPQLTDAQLQAIQARDNKRYISIMIQCSVYDQQITDFQWFYNGRQAIRAFSNINFDYLSGIPDIETADSVYSYWFMVMDDFSTSSDVDPATLAWITKARGLLPNLAANPNSRSSYIIAEGDLSNPETNDGIAAFNALHAYYDANHNTLIPNYQKRVADYEAQQQYLKDHPPIPQNTVINFWRITK